MRSMPSEHRHGRRDMDQIRESTAAGTDGFALFKINSEKGKKRSVGS